MNTHTYTCSDLDEIYKGIGDNLAIMIQQMSTFLAAIVVGFVREWRLALVLLGIVPFMALSTGVLARVRNILS